MFFRFPFLLRPHHTWRTVQDIYDFVGNITLKITRQCVKLAFNLVRNRDISMTTCINKLQYLNSYPVICKILIVFQEKLTSVYQELGSDNAEPVPFKVLMEHPLIQDIVNACSTFKTLVCSLNGLKFSTCTSIVVYTVVLLLVQVFNLDPYTKYNRIPVKD